MARVITKMYVILRYRNSWLGSAAEFNHSSIIRKSLSF